uniref:Uncharacterized protein n=1 Tax=Molossus molossus TaxID=27622 RepID=A0A7J8DTN4_MOLMO|nr:hypothetical protein HJG59_009104 [Molossus molossus]
MAGGAGALFRSTPACRAEERGKGCPARGSSALSAPLALKHAHRHGDIGLFSRLLRSKVIFCSWLRACHSLKESTLILGFKRTSLPWAVRATVSALALTPKSGEFGSQSRACTWVAGSICGPGQGMCRRQPIDVSLAGLFPCLSSLSSPFLSL